MINNIFRYIKDKSVNVSTLKTTHKRTDSDPADIFGRPVQLIIKNLPHPIRALSNPVPFAIRLTTQLESSYWMLTSHLIERVHLQSLTISNMLRNQADLLLKLQCSNRFQI